MAPFCFLVVYWLMRRGKFWLLRLWRKQMLAATIPVRESRFISGPDSESTRWAPLSESALASFFSWRLKRCGRLFAGQLEFGIPGLGCLELLKDEFLKLGRAGRKHDAHIIRVIPTADDLMGDRGRLLANDLLQPIVA